MAKPEQTADDTRALAGVATATADWAHDVAVSLGSFPTRQVIARHLAAAYSLGFIAGNHAPKAGDAFKVK